MDVDEAREFEVLPSMEEDGYESEEEEAEAGRTGLSRPQYDDSHDRPLPSRGG